MGGRPNPLVGVDRLTPGDFVTDGPGVHMEEFEVKALFLKEPV